MKLILLLISLAVLGGCKSKFQRELEKQVDDINTLKAAISLEQGATMEVSKISSSGGERYVVFKNATTGEYIAYNMTKWDSRTMSSLTQYVDDGNDVVRALDRREEWVTTGHYEDITELQWVSKDEWVSEYQYVTRNEYDFSCSCYRDVTNYESVSFWRSTSSYEYVVVGQRYVDDSGYYPFYYGAGFRFDNTSGQTHDLDTLAALREEMTVEGLAGRLKNDYALSADRAHELADLSLKHMRLENQRALTAAEKDAFAVKALGVSMSQVEATMKRRALGDEDSYEEMLKAAAQVNRTTPEMIGRFFDDMIAE
jgi:hypothetical protein